MRHSWADKLEKFEWQVYWGGWLFGGFGSGKSTKKHRGAKTWARRNIRNLFKKTFWGGARGQVRNRGQAVEANSEAVGRGKCAGKKKKGGPTEKEFRPIGVGRVTELMKGGAGGSE